MKQVNTYEELINHIQINNDERIINIENLDITFTLDVREFLQRGNYSTSMDNNSISDEESIIRTSFGLRFRDISCREISASDICFGKDVQFINTNEQSIHKISFNYCEFKSDHQEIYCLHICEQKLSDSLEISNCKFAGNVCVSGLVLCENAKFIIDSSSFGKNILIESIRIEQKAEIEIFGSSKIVGEIIFQRIINMGKIDARCSVEQNLLFYEINQIDEISDFIGTIELHGTTVGGQLRIFKCKISCFCICNCMIEGLFESQFDWLRLKEEASSILRSFAIRSNNNILVEKYTKAFFDQALRQECASVLESLIKHILFKKKMIKRKMSFRTFLKINICEPFILLLLSLGSSHRILLWFNKYSNDYNRSWLRGLLFTFISSIVVFFMLNYLGLKTQIFVVDFRFTDFEFILARYIKLIDVFNLTESHVKLNLNTKGSLILFFGRILIVYGMYQTVYAWYHKWKN